MLYNGFFDTRTRDHGVKCIMFKPNRIVAVIISTLLPEIDEYMTPPYFTVDIVLFIMCTLFSNVAVCTPLHSFFSGIQSFYRPHDQHINFSPQTTHKWRL